MSIGEITKIKGEPHVGFSFNEYILDAWTYLVIKKLWPKDFDLKQFRILEYLNENNLNNYKKIKCKEIEFYIKK